MYKNYETVVSFEEMHITKRDDGEGFKMQAKGLINGEPSTINISKMNQPYLSIDASTDIEELYKDYVFEKIHKLPFSNTTTLNLNAEILEDDNGVRFSIEIDPKYLVNKRIKKSEEELNLINEELKDKINALQKEISELKKLL